MPLRNAEQDRALAWYIKQHELRPSLAAHPKYYFVNKDGDEVSVSITTMMNKYKEYNNEQK